MNKILFYSFFLIYSFLNINKTLVAAEIIPKYQFAATAAKEEYSSILNDIENSLKKVDTSLKKELENFAVSLKVDLFNYLDQKIQNSSSCLAEKIQNLLSLVDSLLVFFEIDSACAEFFNLEEKKIVSLVAVVKDLNSSFTEVLSWQKSANDSKWEKIDLSSKYATKLEITIKSMINKLEVWNSYSAIFYVYGDLLQVELKQLQQNISQFYKNKNDYSKKVLLNSLEKVKNEILTSNQKQLELTPLIKKTVLEIEVLGKSINNNIGNLVLFPQH